MTTIIKFHRYYLHLTENIILKVFYEIAIALPTGGRQYDRYKQRKRGHGEGSLDVDLGFELDIIFSSLTSEEIILEKENRSVLYAAIDQPQPIQARRGYAHYILGKSKTKLARAEDVVERAPNFKP